MLRCGGIPAPAGLGRLPRGTGPPPPSSADACACALGSSPGAREAPQHPRWRARAEAGAVLCAAWAVPLDYRFERAATAHGYRKRLYMKPDVYEISGVDEK